LTHPGFSFVEAIAPCSTAYARWNKEGRGLDPKDLNRRGLEIMKHYQKVGEVVVNSHPKDAFIRVNEKGEIIKIVEGEFLSDPRPDINIAMDQHATAAEQQWLIERQMLDDRPKLPAREDYVARTEVQLGGFGGQGIISAGRIIGTAAAIYDRLEVCFTQSYGPEARGGAAGSQVVISSDPIHHPHLIKPTSMIMMSQGAYDKYAAKLAFGGILLFDDQLVAIPAGDRTDVTRYGISATQIASQEGNQRAANTAMLGFWAAITEIVSFEAMRQAVAESVPSKTKELNLKVMDIGYEQGKKINL
jgi:2-oxoglutarate ferredoxin oxidoreductase subunit gamma